MTVSREDERQGANLIRAERTRQIDEEGWTPDHDAEHSTGELIDAARAYLLCVRWGEVPEAPPNEWPWREEYWKPTEDPVRMLVKAGALIAAEIDRLHRPYHVEVRAKPSEPPQRPGWELSEAEVSRLDQVTLAAARAWGAQRTKPVRLFRSLLAPYTVHRMIWEIQRWRREAAKPTDAAPSSEGRG